MQSAKLDLILVVPPTRGEPEDQQLFTDTHFENLYDHVTAFSLMTYDFSSLQKPGKLIQYFRNSTLIYKLG